MGSNTVSIAVILLNSILVQNIVLGKFLGICPFVGVSKKLDTALGMGMAVTFVIALSSVITYLVQYAYILVPLHIELYADHRLHPGDSGAWCSWWRW